MEVLVFVLHLDLTREKDLLPSTFEEFAKFFSRICFPQIWRAVLFPSEIIKVVSQGHCEILLPVLS